MVTNFLDSITIALHKRFGDAYAYYVDDVEQGLIKPCFTTMALNPLIRSVNPNQYRRVIPVVVHYFTNELNTSDGKKDAYRIAEGIMDTLEYLTVDGSLFRGERIEYSIVENVLEFFITYDFYTTKEAELFYMEHGTLNGVPI